MHGDRSESFRLDSSPTAFLPVKFILSNSASSLEMRGVLMLLFYCVKLSYSTGITQPIGDSHFKVLLGDVDLGPLSQRPELFKVAAVENEVVNVTDDQQTAVVTVGVNIRLDWSSWVTEVLGAESALNASFTYYRTQLSELGSTIGPAEVLRPSERVIIRTDEELNIFYVEIFGAVTVVSPENESDSAIHELEACVSESNGSQLYYRSNITLYVIERPPLLLVECMGRTVAGRASTNCISTNNPIAQRTCTVEAVIPELSDSVVVPCNNTDLEIEITTIDYRPGEYIVIFNLTDIFGQTVQRISPLSLMLPSLSGSCAFELVFESDEFTVVSCQTNLDHHMVTLTYTCSYDGGSGPTEQCGQLIVIEKNQLGPGPHTLTVTVTTGDGDYFTSQLEFQGTRFGINCIINEGRTHTVLCEGKNAAINESTVACVYDSGTMQEKCELPVTIDFSLFDHAPGDHNITIIANSLFGVAEFTSTFFVPAIECIQLTEPGRVNIICQIRVTLDRDSTPYCLVDEHDFNVDIPCGDIHNIAVIPSETLTSSFPLPTNVSLLVSANDSTGDSIRTTLKVTLTKEQLVECSTTVNCSSNSTMMSARECCVNSEDGLSYSIPGQQQCHTCIVFGWFQDSFVGIERETAYNLSVGYLKGAEQAGAGASAILTFDVMPKFITARPSAADISLENTRIEVQPMGEQTFVVFTLAAIEITEEVNEYLALQLVPTPASLQRIPMGEGVFFEQEISLIVMDVVKSSTMRSIPEATASGSTNVIGGIIGAVLSILLVASIILLIVLYLYRRYHRIAKLALKKVDQELFEGGDDYLYTLANPGIERTQISVKSSFELNLPPNLIIPSASIKLNETIGQGEFGIVYKGYIKRSDSHSINEYLAIKTLKGFYDHGMVRDMLKECSRMSTFDHVNVLTLKGVSLDGGPAPYIIMPFMANGSLLAYLKKNRKSLVISSEDADVEMVRKQLMDTCIQVAKGMEYLASMKVVHRDLAARNCMIDINFVIKVADFGLSESIGVKEYFRQDEISAVKLPLKWLPLESINDYIFSEKSDIWAYGVTCWEIFSGGKVPYAELVMREIPKLLAEGYRLDKPSNNACSEEMYSFMHQCWSVEPEHRPSFTQLVESLSNSLEGMAGYVHIGAFGIRSQNGTKVSQYLTIEQ